MSEKTLWENARAYDKERATQAGEEAHFLWREIEDKPHKALQFIQDALDTARGDVCVDGYTQHDWQMRVDLRGEVCRNGTCFKERPLSEDVF